MKLFLITLFTALCGLTYSGEMIQKNSTGMTVVTSDHYKVTFFPRHMLPYRFEVGGKEFIPTFLDALYLRSSKRLYSLHHDRFAEMTIISNSPDAAAISLAGTYCFDASNSAPGGAKAVYVYRFRKDSPIIEVEASISKEDDTEWDELRFLMPAFKQNPFSVLLSSRIEKPVDLSVEQKNDLFVSPRWSVFLDDKIALGVGSEESTTAWCNSKKTYYAYLGRKIFKWQSRHLKLSGQLYIGSAKTHQEFNNIFNKSKN